jgi:hypothetical protein
MHDEVGEQQPALPARQSSLQGLAVNLDEEAPAQLDPRCRRFQYETSYSIARPGVRFRPGN